MIFIHLSQSWHGNPPEHSTSNCLLPKMRVQVRHPSDKRAKKISGLHRKAGQTNPNSTQRDTALRFTAGASVFLDLSRSMSLSSRY